MVAAYLRWRRGSYGSRHSVSREPARTIETLEHVAPRGGEPGMDAQHQYRGCLLGGAVGDALGAPVEFMSLSRICKHFGFGGIRDFAEFGGRKGAVTDETQMSLFTAEGLIRAVVRERHEGAPEYAKVMANAYQRWLRTQGVSNVHGLDPLVPDPGWLYGVKDLHAMRAPGRTSRAALRSVAVLGKPAENDSSGCGGVMRVAPVGLFANDIEESFELGCQIAGLTHGHPTGWLAGGAFAVMITAIRQGASLPDALNTALDCLEYKDGNEALLDALELADDLASEGSDSDTAIAQLGRGWMADEALSIAVYCALRATNFSDGVIMAVNHNGDSDTTAALTGNLLGVIWGEQGIPAQWLKQLELRKVITEVADDLFACRQWSIGPGVGDQELSKRIWAKYPGY
jgi:ADP-ribosylglycohydrolase